MTQRVRFALFLVCGFLLLFALDTAYEARKTLQRLDVIEAERDQWQRPIAILNELDLKSGDVVIDLGCGSGYFALKLSPLVGDHGKVFAVDIRRLSLAFLWMRKVLKGKDNIRVIHGEPANPRLPAGNVNAVLVANTYHELTNPQSILDYLFRSMATGGRLVVVDRSRDAEQRHELPAEVVEAELRQTGFDVLSRNDSLIDDRTNGMWWLISARKP